MRLGIDFGTTRTVVACADRGNYPVLGFVDDAGDCHDWFPSVVADAFLETRLGKPWRSTYGMLDSRFDARAFVNYLFPAG